MKARAEVRVNVYEVISRAVEEGVRNGVYRARKHTDTPNEAQTADAVYQAVMQALCEVLRFED
jgi:hypothetical protein